MDPLTPRHKRVEAGGLPQGSSQGEERSRLATVHFLMRVRRGRIGLAVPCLLLAAITLAIYLPVVKYEFLNYDDLQYVVENPLLSGGLGPGNIRRAFTSTYAAYWIPLTWISYMLDVSLHGLWPGGFHLTNLLLHTANAILLFLLLRSMTGARWRSWWVAAIFAAHPLHVESVAWVTERKDVLATFFFLCALWAWLVYLRRPAGARYAVVTILFALSLMAKPMLVTFPVLLLLLDGWPLRRFGPPMGPGSGRPAPPGLEAAVPSTGAAAGPGRAPRSRLLLEKAPLAGLSLVAAAVTYAAQKGAGSVVSWESLRPATRFGNAVFAYAAYLWKMVWPVGLALRRADHGSMRPLWQMVLAGMLLLAVTLILARLARAHPYALTGWLWYLAALLPVSGLMPAGHQAEASRFTYVPLVGIYLLLAWGVTALGRRGRWTWAPTAMAAVSLLVLVPAAARQTRHWQNSETYFRYVLAVNVDNGLAQYCLADALARQGKHDDAIFHFRRALAIEPDDAESHYGLALSLSELGDDEAAALHYRETLRVSPAYALAHNNLGVILMGRGDEAEALDHFRRAVESQPDMALARHNLAAALERRGDVGEALVQVREAVRLDPGLTRARILLARLLTGQGRREEAVESYREVLGLEPSNEEARAALRGDTAR